MSDREQLLALADRVEAASWPQRDRVLNREVALAVGWVRKTPSEAGRKSPAWFHPDDCRDGHVVMDSLHGTDVWREPLDYLGSIDAAATLVPAPFMWTMDSWSRSQWSAGIWCHSRQWLFTPNVDRQSRTPALALCAAALRARAKL